MAFKNMNSLVKILSLGLLFLFVFVQSSFASASYTLPYPGIMPGNKIYVASELFDTLKKYYTFGDFAKFKYYLSQSDKYLVEAQILFEYGQYPLAKRSLEKSDMHFSQLRNVLESAKKKNKNIVEKEEVLYLASEKHIEVLEKLVKTVPSNFTWKAEKKEPVFIDIKNIINSSIQKRKKI